MEKVTISKVSKFTTDRNGQPLKTSKGKPYTRVIIQTEEHDLPLSGFGNSTTDAWTQGTAVDIEVSKVEKDGKTYLNFSLPKKEVLQSEDMKQLKEDVFKLLVRVGEISNNTRILMDHLLPKKPKAADARYAGDNVTSFDEPELI